MDRSDGEKLQVAFFELGLQPHLPTLTLSSVSEKKESLMAFRAGLWGLQIWITGEVIVLLDEKGFVCSTENKPLTFALCRFESTHGPGALRAVLRRNVVAPYGIEVLRAKYNPGQKVPAVASQPYSPASQRRKLSSADFQKLLSEI